MPVPELAVVPAQRTSTLREYWTARSNEKQLLAGRTAEAPARGSAPTVRRKLELEESMGGHSGHMGSSDVGFVFSINGFVWHAR